jgi:hypothetical protein
MTSHSKDDDKSSFSLDPDVDKEKVEGNYSHPCGISPASAI